MRKHPAVGSGQIVGDQADNYRLSDLDSESKTIFVNFY